MKITEQTSSRLVLYGSPLGQGLIGLFFFLFTVVMAWFLARSVEIRCEIISVNRMNCSLTEKILGITPIETREVREVEAAVVQENEDSDGDTTYRLALITPDGPAPVTKVWSSDYSAKARAADQLNRFLTQNELKSLEIELKVSPWLWFFLGLFGGAGLLLILFAKSVTIEADKNEGAIKIHKDGLIGSYSTEYFLSEIEDVYLEETHSSKGSRLYRVVFHLRDGNDLPLTSVYSSGQKGKAEAVHALREFLQLRGQGSLSREAPDEDSINPQNTWIPPD
jgi:hypothetical protein